MDIRLDIVIPVYNEGKNIIPVLESLQKHVKTPFTVLICYDHDDDNTLEALPSFSNNGMNIVPVKNSGKGSHHAIVTGFKNSSGSAVLVLPADDDYNAPIMDSMVSAFSEGNDIVCASRFMKGGTMKGCPWLKAVLVRVAAFILFHVGRLPTHDATNGFRLFSKKVINKIPIESQSGFAFSLELLVKCHRLGWKIKEIPAAWMERKVGQSRFKLFKWLPIYLRWFFFGLATTFLFRSAKTVSLNQS